MVRTKKIIKDAFLYALNKMGYDIINSYVDKIGEDRKILKEEKESFIRCYKCVFVGSLLGWLEEDGSYDLSAFYEELCKMFSGSGFLNSSEKQNEKSGLVRFFLSFKR